MVEDLDEALLAKLATLKTDPAFVPQLLDQAFLQCRIDVEAIAGSRAEGKIDVLREQAHALYGCAGSVGFIGITAVCDRFRNLQADEIQTRALQFEVELKLALTRLEARLGT